jgi:hypothetical protein
MRALRLPGWIANVVLNYAWLLLVPGTKITVMTVRYVFDAHYACVVFPMHTAQYGGHLKREALCQSTITQSKPKTASKPWDEFFSSDRLNSSSPIYN